MARSPGADLPADFPLPARVVVRERRRDLVRRWWRSRGHQRNLRYWLLFRGLPVLVGLVVLYIVNGFVVGWRDAYDVSLGIESPAETSAPVLAWFLSVAGWLVMPGVAGAVAGYVVSDSIASRRSRTLDELFPQITKDDLRDILRELGDE